MITREIFDLMDKPSLEDKRLIQRAFSFAQKAHEGQKRFSGEDYIIHPFAVAKVLADLKMKAPTIVAGLLHDTLEDTSVTEKDIEKEFGKEVLFLVEGVTKLGKLKYQGAERHVESLRKMFVATAKDIRVIIIRLADRLHNVQTLEYVRPDKQRRIALETLEIYAPIANRLGIWKVKGMLEDISFPYVYPEEYAEAVRLRKTKGKETIKRLEKIYRTLQKELTKRNFKDFEIDYRIKYLYSLYMKLKRYKMDMESIYDVSALRIILPTIEDCYRALGAIHNIWRPVPGRLKDYIAVPKPNGYQAIHTTIFVGDGRVAEIQIKTVEMQTESEYGIASHLGYEHAGKKSKKNALEGQMAWVTELLEWQKKTKESDNYLSGLKINFFDKKIFVFTPKGDVIELPEDSTPIDFAYAIHSDIGDHAAGARVNAKFVSLNHKLQNNDVIQIETKEASHPTIKWLNNIKTGSARKHIKNILGIGGDPKKEG